VIRTLAPVIACAALLLQGCRETTSGEGYDAAVRLGGEWFNCDRLDDAACEVRLMHIPPAYQGDARQNEERSMLRGFRLLRDRFGGVSDVQPPTTAFRMADVFWASGDAAYWSEHSRSSKATFPVKFSKLSSGYVQIEVCKIYSKWQIRAVHYGLPLSNPSSRPMIEMINADLSKVSQ
jgi:hypothetical protein